ncbi:MAG TPA: protein phosphatase CheZ, partial [Dissulfurispiraceae bacterium]|nr:protein phosphatase CheZ [Dissulfurispiraceae bacterium]
MQYIGFTMNGMEYTIPILKVQEIVNLPHLTRLPQVPAYIEGITNLRGRIIPVLNLKKLIGLGGVSSGEKVIVVTSGRIIFGVLIDAVTGVITIEDSAIDPPTDFNTSDMVSGVAKVGEKLIVLLDTKKLVPLEDMSMFEDETFEVKSEDAQSQVLREVDGSGQERPVDHIGNAINFLTRQGVDTADPGYALFDEMISFMNAIAVQDYEKADSAVKCILKKGQNELFQEVGKVTRKLDDSIRSFKEALDPRLKDMAVTEMPNAVDQLNVVIERTEAAANKTMGIVEKYILIMDELASHLRYLKEPEESVKY